MTDIKKTNETQKDHKAQPKPPNFTFTQKKL